MKDIGRNAILKFSLANKMSLLLTPSRIIYNKFPKFFLVAPVAARKDVTLWKRFMPLLPRLPGGLFAGLLMVHLSIPNQVVSSYELICSSVLDFVYVPVHTHGFLGGRSLQPHRNAFAEASRI